MDVQSEKCRICRTVTMVNKAINVFSQFNDKKAYLQLIQDFAPIDILPEDPLPKIICRDCSNKLQFLFDFQQQIINSDLLLKQEIHKGNTQEFYMEFDVKSEFLELQLELKKDNVEAMNEPNNKTNVVDIKLDYVETERKVQEDTKNIKLNRDCSYTCKKIFSCDLCKKRFTSKHTLIFHKRVHTKERPHTCEICSKSFVFPAALINHKKVQHVGEKKFQCTICNKAFVLRQSLKVHLSTHKEDRDFLCEICSCSFKSTAGLYRHKRLMHTEKVKCGLCHKLFAPTILNRHVKEHKAREQGVKHICDICGKGFTCSTSRKRHLRVHTGEKPYFCKICGKNFNQGSTLKTHMKVHFDKMPYACEYCPKSFKYKQQFQSHIANHHSGMGFDCSTDQNG